MTDLERMAFVLEARAHRRECALCDAGENCVVFNDIELRYMRASGAIVNVLEAPVPFEYRPRQGSCGTTRPLDTQAAAGSRSDEK